MPRSFSQRTSEKKSRTTKLRFEALETRDLMAPLANLTAYRPVTEYINYAQYAVPEAVETSVTNGPGIRINGDDDNKNNIADNLDTTATTAENDLVRVDVAGSGGALSVNWSGDLKVWASNTKGAAITKGSNVANGQALWVEYVGVNHTSGATTSLTLTTSDGQTSAQDQVVFHTFQSDVLVIGGNTQYPAKVGDPSLGIFTTGTLLYQQGYDVHLYSHDQVQSNGQGAAYTEASNAILKRKVNSLAILGYSWGGGATYDLATGLRANTSLTNKYTLKYTAYVDGIKHSSISAEQRLPTGTQYHDNLFQRKDWLLRGNTVTGANNVNVTSTLWGSGLVHTTIDDNTMVQTILVGNLSQRVVR